MTIQNEVYREDYSGNGSATSFPVSFYFFDDAHLKVLLLSAAGVETEQVLNTDYTVLGAGNPAGGSVEMVVPPATGETLTIIRNVPFTQLLDYVENDNFPAQSHENGLDKLTMIVQQQQEEIDRTFRVAPAYEPATDFEMIPAANEILIWNATGDKFVTLDPADLRIRRLYYDQDNATDVAITGGVEVFGELRFNNTFDATIRMVTGELILEFTVGGETKFFANDEEKLRTTNNGISVRNATEIEMIGGGTSLKIIKGA